MILRRLLANIGLITSLVCTGWLIVAIASTQPPDSNYTRFHVYAREGTTMQVREGTLQVVDSGSLATSAVGIQDVTYAALALCCLISISTSIVLLRQTRSRQQYVQRLPTNV